MSCSKWQADIALYAGGDLPDAQTARVASHLAECADCRALAGELRAAQELLAELRDEPLADVVVADVRRRVLAEIGARRPARPYWKWAVAAALALAAVWMGPWQRPHKPVPVAQVEPPRMVLPPPPAIVRVRQHAMHRRRRAPAAQPSPPLLVQFVTDNPNIVIYWLIDQKPEGD